jgi:adenylylsulfate kinase
MGLPGSGKSTLSGALTNVVVNAGKGYHTINADAVRKILNDWDFSIEGRLKQAKRLAALAADSESEFVITDFVAPLPESREIFNADYTVWVNTIQKGRFDDTNAMFVPPDKFDIMVNTQDANNWAKLIYDLIVFKFS